MKNLILIVGQGKRCGKDTVANKLQMLLSKSRKKCKCIALADPIYKILSDLQILTEKDKELKTDDYRFFMGYLGQLYNNDSWKDDSNSSLFKEYIKIREDLLKDKEEAYTTWGGIDYLYKYFKCNAIDMYMDHFYKYKLKSLNLEGINLWCEMTSSEIDKISNIDNIIVTDCRQLREYEYLLNHYVDKNIYIILLSSNSEKVDTTAFLQNEGLYTILTDRNMDYRCSSIQECEKYGEFMRSYIFYTRFLGGKKKFFNIQNNIDENGNFDNAHLERQLRLIVNEF